MRAIQTMLLGISMMLLGGFFSVSSASSLDEIGLLIVLVGFVVTVAAFMNRKDNT